MKKILSVITIIASAPLLSGCIALIAMEGLNDITPCSPKAFKQAQIFESVEPYLTPGQTMYNVKGMLGHPVQYTKAMSRQGEVLDVLYYPTKVKACRNMGGKDEVTPLVFSRGQLTGYGPRHYKQQVASRI